MNTVFGNAERLDLIDSAILLNCRQHNSHLRARRDSHHGSRSPPRRRMQSDHVSPTDLIRDAHQAISDSLVELETRAA